jgi:Zn-dependent metalloprotease
VDTLYDLIPSVHQFYLDRFNRDGGNARGGLGDGKTVPWTTTRAYTYAEFIETPYECPNAGYGITGMWFCRGTVNPDIVGHEYSHAIDMFSHYDTTGNPIGTVYQGESGALNENQADLFGVTFTRFYGGTTDWISGTSTGGRNLADPSNSSAFALNGICLPDRYRSERFYCGTDDHSGVHVNSTVSSKAAYLLAEGGRFNGCTMTGIGIDKTLQIWYRAVTQYYSTAETFNGAYVKLIQAATDLHGADSLEVRQVRRALQSVELDQPGFCSGQPARVPDALDLEGW